MDKSSLADLTAILQMQVHAAKAELHKVRLRENRLLALLQDLDTQRSTTTHRDPSQPSATIDFQNDLQLRRWTDQRRASVNIELAQVRAIMAMAKSNLAHHHARRDALNSVAARLAQQDKLEQRRKDYYGS